MQVHCRSEQGGKRAVAFGVFAIGYVSRPLGGIVLSSLGDRFGRRVIFLVSVLAMSAATIGIGLIPGYASIGVLAPVLLVLLLSHKAFSSRANCLARSRTSLKRFRFERVSSADS
ncbi:hypothetical protein [Paraburkholderia caledonica]|uniref:MFS family permease n=1 Tax=Paraburkholderia caledonica TaxID=134536 RepID=A0AB73I7Z4_9BURK|nr:MFS family permease [Paraburkholderia caledonica]